MTTQTDVVKINREGVITLNGENVGYVKKEIRQGIFATALGISASGSGTPYWVPFAADGTQLNEYGYKTRKRAVKRVTDHAQPLTVSNVRRESGWNGEFVSASVMFKGYYFGVSRYADESVWVCDSMSTPESICPVFSNGSGTRVTAVRPLKEEFAEVVTDAAIAAGVWPMSASAGK